MLFIRQHTKLVDLSIGILSHTIVFILLMQNRHCWHCIQYWNYWAWKLSLPVRVCTCSCSSHAPTGYLTALVMITEEEHVHMACHLNEFGLAFKCHKQPTTRGPPYCQWWVDDTADTASTHQMQSTYANAWSWELLVKHMLENYTWHMMRVEWTNAMMVKSHLPPQITSWLFCSWAMVILIV